MTDFLRLSVIAGIGITLSITASGCSYVNLDSVLQPSAPEASPKVETPHSTPSVGGQFPPPPTKPDSPPKSTADPDMKPEQLVGLNQEQVVSYLGPATDTREVPPATVWEYRVNGCALDLFFYMDIGEKRFRTLAYDMRSLDGGKGGVALANCLERIKERRRD